MTRYDIKTVPGEREIPERMCVACRTRRRKNGFIRVYRADDGTVREDETGRHPGRGAYICFDQGCVEKAICQRRLERSLKAGMTDETARRLREAAKERQR